MWTRRVDLPQRSQTPPPLIMAPSIGLWLSVLGPARIGGSLPRPPRFSMRLIMSWDTAHILTGCRFDQRSNDMPQVTRLSWNARDMPLILHWLANMWRWYLAEMREFSVWRPRCSKRPMTTAMPESTSLCCPGLRQLKPSLPGPVRHLAVITL